MISVTNLSYYLGSRALYENASMHIKPGQKIGLIGLNGTGKSTLLRLIIGEYQPDGGTISKAGDVSIGFLNQDLLSYQTDDSILAVAMQAFERQNILQRRIDELLHQMEVAYTDDLVDKLGKAQEEFESLDGYTIQAKAEEILEGLGFRTDDLHKPLRQFSGGWRMRVMLAKLLLQKPSLLMLDEPTNHLDLPSIQWVEKYIQNYEGAVIVVSHDREFLDNVVDSIVEVSGAKLNFYAGNYSFYVEEKSLRNEIQQGAYENQQAKIRQTERFIERFKAKATKAKQAQSRVKMLEKMDLVDAVIDENARVNFRFNFSTQPGRHILHLDEVSKAYSDKKILTHTTARLERGDHVALIGANGKGKSTLLRIIAGTEPVSQGERRLGHNVAFSFYAQHQLESLKVDDNMLEELKSSNPTKSEAELRTVLGCFLFSGDDVFKKIKVLSGGEKSRVALAKVLLSQANFLLLDEPTNHLDMQSVNILIQALQQYEGTYIVVSHDRYFVSQIANKIWYIEDEHVKQYPGTYDEYEWWQEERKQQGGDGKGPKEVPATPVAAAPKPKPQATDDERKEWQRALKKASQQADEMEQKIGGLERQKQQLEVEMSKTDVLADGRKLQTKTADYERITTQIESLQEKWEEAMLEVEEWEKKLA